MNTETPAPTFGLTRSDRQETHRAKADVADGPQLRDTYGRPFRVDRVVAYWGRQDGGAWRLEWVKLSGPRVLKSGTPSGTRLDLHLDHVTPSRRPDWVNTWLVTNEPKATGQ